MTRCRSKEREKEDARSIEGVLGLDVKEFRVQDFAKLSNISPKTISFFSSKERKHIFHVKNSFTRNIYEYVFCTALHFTCNYVAFHRYLQNVSRINIETDDYFLRHFLPLLNIWGIWGINNNWIRCKKQTSIKKFNFSKSLY